MVRAVGLPPGSFPGRCCSDGRGYRSDGRLRRPGSANGSNAPRTSTLGDGVSDRDVARLRSGWISSRSHDDSVGNDPDAGRLSRFPVSSRRTDAPLLRSPHTLQLLPTTATSKSADVPRLSVSSGGPTQHPAFTWQQRWRPWCRPRNRSSQLTAAAALTMRDSTSPNKSHRLCAHSHSAHCRALTQLAEHVRRLHTLTSARLYHSCRTLQSCVPNAV